MDFNYKFPYTVLTPSNPLYHKQRIARGKFYRTQWLKYHPNSPGSLQHGKTTTQFSDIYDPLSGVVLSIPLPVDEKVRRSLGDGT